MELHVYPSLCTHLVEGQLVRLGVEYDEHASEAMGSGERASLSQLREHALCDTVNDLTRLGSRRVDAAVGDHTAQRCSSAETTGRLDEQRPRSGVRGSDRSADARAAAANDHDVMVWPRLGGPGV